MATPGRLHVREHRDERQLQLVQHALEPRLVGQRSRPSDSRAAAAASTVTAACSGPRSSPGARQLDVQALGADVRERLGAQGRVQDVGRDLGVEDHPRQRAAAPAQARGGGRVAARQLPHQQRLDVVAGQRLAGGHHGLRERRRVLRAGRDDPAVRAPDREAEQRAPARSHVVERRADGQLRLGREPRREVVAGRPRGHDARIGEHGPQQLHRVARGRPSMRPAARTRLGRGDRAGWRRPPARIEVEAQLQPAPLTRDGRPGPTAPVRRPAPPAPARAGPPPAAGRPAPRASSPSIAGSRSTSVRNSYSRNSRMTSARSYWPSFAASMSSSTGRVPVDGHQVAPQQHVVPVRDELVAQLVRLDLVHVLEHAIERAVVLEQLGRGLVADARQAPGCCRSCRP